jgi:hypothetical protein
MWIGSARYGSVFNFAEQRLTRQTVSLGTASPFLAPTSRTKRTSNRHQACFRWIENYLLHILAEPSVKSFWLETHEMQFSTLKYSADSWDDNCEDSKKIRETPRTHVANR